MLARWAMEPEVGLEESIDWTGKPFGTRNLYLLAKHGHADNLFIGIRGGIQWLRDKSNEDILERPSWEISFRQKTPHNWFGAEEFVLELESRGIVFE